MYLMSSGIVFELYDMIQMFLVSFQSLLTNSLIEI